ncbi:uncharacterized protein [Drosophila kikkawai]|uniref:MD-2-related lipid-recognition domain-containing protein n=1 Tax=Drosophila kikkawai TaxID=30033 RepID=A0A6P4IVP2_DROKI|nr:uncharacterized protein LOC108077904 [Drosophila kikkawai]
MRAVYFFSLFLITTLVVVDGKFKSLFCTCYDPDFGEFPLCRIKAINRYRNSIGITFLQKQRTEGGTVRLELFNRANGWRPFLYNISANICDVLDKNNNIIMAIGLAYLRPYLGPSAGCPFKANDTFKCVDLEFEFDHFRTRFPIETGEYALKLSFYYRKTLKLSINGSAEYSNYREH